MFSMNPMPGKNVLPLSSREWLDANRQGARFSFGRYTGNTPVTGKPNPKSVRFRKDYEEFSRQSAKVRSDPELRYHFPNLDGVPAEKWLQFFHNLFLFLKWFMY